MDTQHSVRLNQRSQQEYRDNLITCTKLAQFRPVVLSLMTQDELISEVQKLCDLTAELGNELEKGGASMSKNRCNCSNCRYGCLGEGD